MIIFEYPVPFFFRYTKYDGTVVCSFVSDQVGFLVHRPVTQENAARRMILCPRRNEQGYGVVL